MRIVIIGSGFGGLAAATRLQAQGHEVVVVEKRDQPGGRASVFRQRGFVFDAGPTIITAPALLDELFALAGKQTRDAVRLVPLDPYYNVRFRRSACSTGRLLSSTRSPDFLSSAARAVHSRRTRVETTMRHRSPLAAGVATRSRTSTAPDTAPGARSPSRMARRRRCR